MRTGRLAQSRARAALGDDDGARPVGLEAEVVQAQGTGDGAGRQVVVHRERTVVHLGTRVGVGACPAGQRDVADLLHLRPELGHVALSHDRKDLARREQPVGQEELVVATTAAHRGLGRRGLAVAAPGPTVQLPEHEDRRRLAGQDGTDGLRDHGAGGDSPWSHLSPIRDVGDPERVGQIVGADRVHVAPDNPVDVARERPASSIAASAAWVASVRSLRPDAREKSVAPMPTIAHRSR